MAAPQLAGAVDAGIEIGVDAPARRMLAEHQEAAADARLARRAAGDPQGMHEIPGIDQAEAERAGSQRDHADLHDITVEDQRNAVAVTAGHLPEF